MIDVTVKTLDSQNHSFTLNDDITVRGFKEHIAESVSVPADSQRLIYCGRVLQDDKKLNDYDVNGKVIHLVQRAPPQAGQRSGNNGGQDAGWHSRSQYRHTRTQVHGNTMYLGAMSFAPDTVEGVPVSQLSSTLSSTRLVVAKRMLMQARQLIDRLDDPNSAPPNQDTESSQQEEQVLPEPDEEAEENQGSNVLTGGTRLSQTAQAALAATLSAAGLNNVTLLSGPSDENNGTADSTSAGTTPIDQSNAQQQQNSTTNVDDQTNVPGETQVPRPPQMAQLLESLLTVQERLRPYIERYRVLMLADPSLSPGPGPEGVEENQRIIDGVSESLHFLSHACHALSEIIVNMGQQPPRNLRCRPIIIQHSTFVQAGIPIQVEAHISLHGRNANNNNPNGEANDSGANESTQESADSQESANTNNTSSGPPQQDQTDQNEQRYQTLNPFGSAFNLPNNVEVLMEVSPEGGMDTGLNEQNQNNTNNNNNAAGGVNNGGANGIFPWGAAPPPDFIRNLMQVVAGHMVQSGMTPAATTTLNPTTATTQQPTTLTGDNGNTNSSQNTQARGNVGTHPTTATQTRSTSRPHVFYPHVHPLGFGTGIGHEREFDPFLPCYSHHVRRNPAGNAQNAQTNQESANNRENQTQSTAPSSTAGTNQAGPTPAPNPQATIPNPFMNHLRQLLSDSGAQAAQTAPNTVSAGAILGQSIGNLIQMFAGRGIHGGFISDRGNHAHEVNLANLFNGSSGVRLDIGVGQVPREQDSFLIDLTLLLAQNMTMEMLTSFGMGDGSPIIELRRPLREFFQHSFPSATSPAEIQEQATERLLSELRPHLRNHLVAEDDTNNRSVSRIDVVATVEALMRRHIQNELRLLFDDSIDDAEFSQSILTVINNLGTQLCTVLRYCLRGGQAGLEAIVMRLVTDIMEGNRSPIRQMILNGFITSFRIFSLRVPQPPESEILSLLVYTDVPNPPSSGSTAAQQPSLPQPKPEPMETEAAEERVSNNDTLAEEEEPNPGTFPGHENLPSDWVPIIARDSIRETRQHRMQTIDSNVVTTFSDAYLGGMPSKRRKLIEQQKPRLLASPTPNHSAISISIERLVREGVNRAGVEEIEGAAAAVASDSGVRRAFGQAIRECLHPRRYRTPDFPDPHRFPNATKYFGEHGRSSK